MPAFRMPCPLRAKGEAAVLADIPNCIYAADFTFDRAGWLQAGKFTAAHLPAALRKPWYSLIGRSPSQGKRLTGPSITTKTTHSPPERSPRP